MKAAVILAASLAGFSLCANARAEMLTSQSRQFVIHYNPTREVVNVPPGSIEVAPQLLPITAERVKAAVVAELPALAVSRTQIHLGVLDRLSPDSPLAVASSRFADTWRYDVGLPRATEEKKLVKALVSVLLLEYANRSSDRGAELPAWVIDGMTEQLQFSIGPKLVVDRKPDAWEAASRDLQAWSRQALRTNSAPTFQEITTTTPPEPRSARESLYLGSTHLLVRSLLEMPQGRQRFAQFLQLLPATWNWQTAFLQAFGFERMLDVEKWWALAVTDFTTRDQRQAWSTPASAQRLGEVLVTTVEYHASTNALPESRQLDLRGLLVQTDFDLQQQALTQKISELAMMAPRLSPQVSVLAQEYKRALELYLQRRSSQSVSPSLRASPEAQRQAIVDETLRQISTLETKRRAIGG